MYERKRREYEKMTIYTQQAINTTGTLKAKYRFTVYFKKGYKARRRYDVETYSTRYNVASNVNEMMRDTHKYAKIAVSNMIGESVYNYTFSSFLQDYVFMYGDTQAKNKKGVTYTNEYLNDQIPETDRKKSVYGKTLKNKKQETQFHKTSKWKYEQKLKARKAEVIMRNDKHTERKTDANTKNKKTNRTTQKIKYTSKKQNKSKYAGRTGNKNKSTTKIKRKNK